MTDDVVDLDVEERRLKLQRGLQRKSPDKIQAQLLDLPDPIKAIPRRQWLYGQHYVRGFMSCTIGTGGVGKSNLILAEALAMASGHDLLGHPVEKPLKIWVHNGEDPKDELLRRFAAACIHYDLRREDYYGRLFVTSGRTMPILVAGMRHFDVVQNGAVVNQIKESIVANGIDVFCADPLAACHSVEENSNMAMGSVIRIFCDIAEDCDCAVELLHHPRKPNGQETEVEHARGASALIAASRSARALNVLSKDEHSKWRFTGNRRAYFKVLNGKANLTLPPDDGEIFQILTVALGNGENDAPGDLVGVVNRRYPQSAADELSEEQIRDLLAALAIGGPWREDQRATDQPWVGTVIARVLKLDISSEAGKWQVATLIKNWLETGRLVRRQLRGQNRHWHWYIEPG